MAYTHNYIPYNYLCPYVNTLKSCINLFISLIHQLKSFSTFSIHYTKISSRRLINEHEQFNLKHSLKHILSQKYCENTIHVLFMGSLFMCHYSHEHYSCVTIHVTVHGSLKSMTISGLIHTNTIYFINYETNTPNSPYTVTDCPNGLQKFQQFGPKFWD